MSELLRKQIHDWEYEKIKSNPRMYGGDKGSPLIMKAYIQEFHSGKKAEQLADSVYSILSTVNRVKNDLLLKNPQFDFREKNKPKTKKQKIGITSTDNAQGLR